jgi:dolichol kinase
MNQTDNATIQYRDELVRKLIHLCSLSIPVIYYFIPRNIAVVILGALSVFALTLDLGRHFSSNVGSVFYRFFGFMLRQHEKDSKKKNLNGATYVLISALLTAIIFPKVIFINAFAILIISDTMAALIGRKYGRHKFLAKSLEGTLAFFVSAVIVSLLTPKLGAGIAEYIIAITASGIGAIVENISFGWADDNLSIPMSIGFVMWGMYALLLPGLNLVLHNAPL